jgi:oxygen-independent coproporphyrinogen III oxidase
MKPFSLYIHIPFCLHKCAYCDFNSYAASPIPEKDYVAAVLSELDFRISLPEWRDRTVNTIYFGGGTPSLFSPASIAKIMNHIFRTMPVDELVEITLEANPGTVTLDRLAGYHDAGLNRLSLGAQSFNRKILSLLGRIHAPQHTEEAVACARAAGFANVSLDIMYGVPQQSMAELRSDLRELMRLAPCHVSAYALTLEKGTRLYQSYRKGMLTLPSEAAVLQHTHEVTAFLSAQHLERYEISNFARRGREARHNLAYWNGDDYLGLGAGAHSYLACSPAAPKRMGLRWANQAAPDKYMLEAVSSGRAEAEQEVLSLREAMFEFFFLGLRKCAGVNLKDFERRFCAEAEAVYPQTIELLTQGGFAALEGCYFSLTPKGMLVADSVMESFAGPKIKKAWLKSGKLSTGGTPGPEQAPITELSDSASRSWRL